MSVFDRVALDEALAQLPAGYRSVFVLHDIEGYDHEEVARLLCIAAGSRLKKISPSE